MSSPNEHNLLASSVPTEVERLVVVSGCSLSPLRLRLDRSSIPGNLGALQQPGTQTSARILKIGEAV